MSEPAAVYKTNTTPEALACPFCGCTDLHSNEWSIGDEDAERIGADIDEGEVWAWECSNCLGSAPMASWNKRPRPWKYPPELPAPGQRVIHTYRQSDGEESRTIVSAYSDDDSLLPIVRWMEIPDEAT